MTALALAPSFQGQQVRIILVNDEPWFVAADVAAILGYRMASDAARLLEDDERGTQTVRTPSGDQQMVTINESGLYGLIFRSRRPEAVAFRRWVTGTVLPEIRRTGTFNGSAPAIPQSLPEALRLAADLAEERDRAQAALAAATPMVEAYSALMDADGFYDMGAAAKAIDLPGVGRNNLMKHLRALGILQHDNLPYQRYLHHFEVVLGTFTDRHGATHPTATTKVQPGSVDWLRRRVAEHLGIQS